MARRDGARALARRFFPDRSLGFKRQSSPRALGASILDVPSTGQGRDRDVAPSPGETSRAMAASEWQHAGAPAFPSVGLAAEGTVPGATPGSVARLACQGCGKPGILPSRTNLSDTG